MTQTQTTERLLASLKRHSPAKVRAYAGDDDARDIAVPQRRKRWVQVIEAIDARSWTRVELLDKSGAVLGYVDNVEPARELEEVGGGVSKTRSEAEWIVNLVVRAQKEAMAYRDSEVSNLLQAQGSVVREMSSAMRELAAIYREQREAATEVASMQAAAEAGNSSDLKQLIEAAPHILQALPMLRQLLSPSGPKNGA